MRSIADAEQAHPQALRVAAYYDAETEPFYLRLWDSEDIHFGLFEDGTRDLRPALKAMTRAIVAPAALQPGEMVVDAGCGVGGAALDIARDYGVTVVGLTVSARQVELARARASAAGLAGQVRFEQADCASVLPFADGSVDAVVSIEAACHFADKARFLAECRRILRPGGRLTASDWIRVPARDNVDAVADAALAAVEEAWHLAGLATLDEWHALLTATGFTDIATHDFDDAVRPNIALLTRARLDRMLERAGAGGGWDPCDPWLEQYGSLCEAWSSRFFSIGALVAEAYASPMNSAADDRATTVESYLHWKCNTRRRER